MDRLSCTIQRPNTLPSLQPPFLSNPPDTTSTALSWGLYCLARYPEAQDRLAEELSAHGFMGQGAGFPTYDELLRLPYLDALFKETLRL